MVLYWLVRTKEPRGQGNYYHTFASQEMCEHVKRENNSRYQLFRTKTLHLQFPLIQNTGKYLTIETQHYNTLLVVLIVQ